MLKIMYDSKQLVCMMLLVSGAFYKGTNAKNIYPARGDPCKDTGQHTNDRVTEANKQQERDEKPPYDDPTGKELWDKDIAGYNNLIGTGKLETRKRKAEIDPTGIRDNAEGSEDDDLTNSGLWMMKVKLTEDDPIAEGLQGTWEDGTVSSVYTRFSHGYKELKESKRSKENRESTPSRRHTQHQAESKPPSSRACGSCGPPCGSCGPPCGSCSPCSVSSGCCNNGICCTDGVCCDPTGANCPANRQKTTQLAQNAAMWAKAASDAQNPAGEQASHQVKVQLADKACQASNSAQAALAGKQAMVDAFQEQIGDAKAVMQEQLVSLNNLKNSADNANQLQCDAQMQVKILAGAYQNAQCYAQQMSALAQSVQVIQDEKVSLMECAQRQIEDLYCQLNQARQEMEATCCAAQAAARSAAEAQQNAQRCKKRDLPDEGESQDAVKYDEGPSESAQFFGSRNRGSKASGNAVPPPVPRASCFVLPTCTPCCQPTCAPPCPPCRGPVCGGCSTCQTGSGGACGACLQRNMQQSTVDAQYAAQEAEAASGAQNAAGQQASFQVRAQLAEKACQASNSAQAALAGKQATVDQLQEQIRDAESVLQEEASNLEIVQATVALTNKEACVAGEQLQTIAAAMQNAEIHATAVQQIACNLNTLHQQKCQLINDAQRQIDQLICQLNDARQDLDDTCEAAQQAAAAAQQAQQNAQRCRRKAARLRDRRRAYRAAELRSRRTL